MGCRTRVLNGKRHAAAFTLVEVMVVVAIIGLILAIAIPNWVKTRTRAQTDICIENLSQLETAKQLWALEFGKAAGETPDEDDLCGPDRYIKSMPICPASGEYSINPIGTNATCSIEGHFLSF
ncbi:MAG: prepilin-type N-terminal cleavage/methylation domain-containing protein [Verrucomicrobia bacterium]|nr:prepilin-type N-terminal cleavage/methylation domain-containing protein [Verrucomicrobiota bacterium]